MNGVDFLSKGEEKSPTKKRKDVPERWENYTKCGKNIPDTPFLAFKGSFISKGSS